MNKKITKILQGSIAPLAILAVVIAVYLAQNHLKMQNLTTAAKPAPDNQCEFVNGRCDFTVAGQSARAEFISPAITEESVTVRFTLPGPVSVKSVWIEGDNMYMGKIPVLVENESENSWSGWFMLGSCSQPVMHWKMLVNIEGQPKPALLYFTTS